MIIAAAVKAVVTVLGGVRATVFAGVALVALIALGTATWQVHSLQVDVANAKADKTTLEASLSKAQLDASQAARESERNAAALMGRAGTIYNEGFRDAQDAGDRTAAGLRDGTLRLRHEWAGCETARLSEAAGRAAGAPSEANGVAGRAGRIVRAADECTAQVMGLQTALMACMATKPK